VYVGDGIRPKYLGILETVECSIFVIEPLSSAAIRPSVCLSVCLSVPSPGSKTMHFRTMITVAH